MTRILSICISSMLLASPMFSAIFSENFEIYENTRDELFEQNKESFENDFKRYRVSTENMNLYSFYEWPKTIPGKVSYLLLVESSGYMYVYVAEYSMIDDHLKIYSCEYDIAKHLFSEFVTKENYLTNKKNKGRK